MRTIAFLVGAAFALLACQSSSRSEGSLSLEEKKRRLESLRQELFRLQAQIAELEESIQAQDTTFGRKRRIPVSYIILHPRPFTSYLQFQGSVENRAVVTLSAKIPAPVVRVYVREGEFVRSGQLLIEQEAEVLRKNLQELRTRLELARELYEKQKRLYEEGIGTEVQFLTAKNTKESLEASIATIEEQLRNAQIRAPFAGRVDAILVRIGELASPGLPAVRLVSSGEWEIKMEVPESFLTLAAPGKKVEVYIPDLNVSFQSRLGVVATNINPLSRAFTVTVREIPAEVQRLLRPNLVAYLRLPQSEVTDALVVPIDAVEFQDTAAYVYVVRGDIARRLRVSVVGTERGEVALAGPIKAGDTLVTAGAALLSDGQPIQLVEEGL
ncbi:MAG: efflux RND transporter periplasmic adaptor subunit [Bacteroidia bacterium]|nr:efflux RND transporter periplasmic adaptor subunit [Bacteroidia bacterium]MDW8014948.1 efflux RND transporter periplasmic adaptor subunit [Bacteroidia bacterium]